MDFRKTAIEGLFSENKVPKAGQQEEQNCHNARNTDQ